MGLAVVRLAIVIKFIVNYIINAFLIVHKDNIIMKLESFIINNNLIILLEYVKHVDLDVKTV